MKPEEIKNIVIQSINDLQTIREQQGKSEVYVLPYDAFQYYHFLVRSANIDDKHSFPELSKFMYYVYKLSVDLLNEEHGVQICSVRPKTQQLDGENYTYEDKILGYAIPREKSPITSEYVFHDYQYHLIDEKKRNILNDKRKICMQNYVTMLLK